MKNLILIIGMVLCCTGAYAADRTSQEPVFALDDLGSGIVSAPVLTDEQLADILKRCLEFVNDGDEDLNRIISTNAVYTPLTRRSIAADQAKEAQKDLERIDRETKLRKDIERALGVLKGE